jgi:glycosyltransferase involved in cell wall biosynthesis
MKKRIGILATNLQHPNPRGVQRVARGVAEYLAGQGGEEFEFLCLAERVPNQYEITYQACDLGPWLARNPLRFGTGPQDPAARPVRCPGPLGRAVRGVAKACLAPFVPPLVFPFLLLLYRALRYPPVLGAWALREVLKVPRHARAVAALMAARMAAVRLRRPGTDRTGKAIAYDAITPDLLDAIVSFEVHEEIWSLPIENYPTRLITWFHDATSKRVADESRWNLDNMESGVSACVYRADKIVCVSHSARGDLHAFFDVPPERTCVIHNGHDAERFARPVPEATLREVWARLGIDARLPYLIALGGVEGRKNSINMIRACVHLRKRRPELRFQMVFVGRVNMLPGLRFHIEQARRYLPVVHAGYGKDGDVPLLLAGARGLLYPSLWEGFGIPPLEAMSAGTLVIASELAALPEVCGGHALYCDPYDPASIATSIEECLLMSAAERQRRVHAARQHAAQFTWERTGEKLLQLLRAELAAGRPAEVNGFVGPREARPLGISA